MGLKNWTTTQKSLKDKKNGYLNYVRYLFDKEHPSHKDQEIISVYDERLINSKKSNLFKLYDTYDNSILISKKGRFNKGGSRSYGVSILFSFPEKIGLDATKMKDIAHYMAYDYIKYVAQEHKLNFGKNEILEFIKNYVISAIHLKKNNPHIHLVIPHVFPVYKTKTIENKGFFKNTTETVKERASLVKINLTKRKYIFNAKQSLNKLLKDKYRIDHNQYIIENHATKKRKTSKLVYKEAKLNDALLKTQKELEDLQVQKRELHLLKNEINEKGLKVLENIEIYERRLKDAFESNDNEKADKYLKYIKTNISKLVSTIEKGKNKTAPK